MAFWKRKKRRRRRSKKNVGQNTQNRFVHHRVVNNTFSRLEDSRKYFKRLSDELLKKVRKKNRALFNLLEPRVLLSKKKYNKYQKSTLHKAHYGTFKYTFYNSPPRLLCKLSFSKTANVLPAISTIISPFQALKPNIKNF